MYIVIMDYSDKNFTDMVSFTYIIAVSSMDFQRHQVWKLVPNIQGHQRIRSITNTISVWSIRVVLL